jgi:hypothetical protein
MFERHIRNVCRKEIPPNDNLKQHQSKEAEKELLREMRKKKRRSLDLRERLKLVKGPKLDLGEEALSYFGWSIMPQESV